jgi:hypothetical protein
MADPNPYAPSSSKIADPQAHEIPGSLWDGVLQGCKAGLKWMTCIFWTFASAVLVVGLAITSYRLGFREGILRLAKEDLAGTLASLLGAYLVACTVGILLGVVIGAAVYLNRRWLQRTRRRD